MLISYGNITAGDDTYEDFDEGGGSDGELLILTFFTGDVLRTGRLVWRARRAESCVAA